jgi:FKBP-type peptidyl-prolyl cis-trans isomerase FkpA
MKQIFNAAVVCVIALSACTVPFKKAKDGSDYKVISAKDGAKVIIGHYMEMNVVAKYKDSVLYSTVEEGMPQYGVYDTANFPSPYKEAFKNLRIGDSIVVRMSSDSIIAKGQSAPFMQKGQFVYQTYTITNAYATKEQVDSAQKTHIPVAKAKAHKKQMDQVQKDLVANKDQIAKDSKIIEDYLAKNNIKATKAAWGTYVAIQTEGTGEKLTSNDIASVNYTGKTFDSSKVFDSNTDPKFKHVQPYDVNIGQLSGIILGWPDALKEMKKGTKATVYIPSSLAYAKNGNPQGGINPDAILVFDMEVVNVTNEEAMMAQEAEMQKKAQEAQMKMADSLQKAGKK